jgi:pSer/pThr/pTyr-binding forkhead associated (FHA) protein
MNGPLDGKRWPFERDIAIGRDERVVEAALPTDRAVSRRHAAVSLQNGHLVLTDLGSSNGTIVDGKLIEQPVAIDEGDPFLVGRTLLRVLGAADAR